MSSLGSNYIPWIKLKATVSQEIEVPMCFYCLLCKLIGSKVLGDDLDMSFFMCENNEYDPPNRYGKDQPKVLHRTLWFWNLDLVLISNLTWTKTPPPLCDFMQWLDTEQSQHAKDHVQCETRWAAKRWKWLLHEEQQEESVRKNKKRFGKRMEEVDRQDTEEREANRKKRWERAPRVMEATRCY